MLSIIKKLKFKGKWRIYQKRVLDELNSHLDDSKLNVVAAPGAGKLVDISIDYYEKFTN